MDELPFIDTLSRTATRNPEAVWASLESFAARIGFRGSMLPRVWGTVPPRGFAITDAAPGHSLTLEGRHRFSRYRLVFLVEEGAAGRGSVLQASTYADFPGVLGRIYRFLVIGTGLHVLATRQVLRSIVKLA